MDPDSKRLKPQEKLSKDSEDSNSASKMQPPRKPMLNLFQLSLILAACPNWIGARSLEASEGQVAVMSQQEQQLTNEQQATPIITSRPPTTPTEGERETERDQDETKTSTTKPQIVSNDHEPARDSKGRVIRKILNHIDHKSELDHRDYVVSDLEFELVLKRLTSRGRLEAEAGEEEASETRATSGSPGASQESENEVAQQQQEHTTNKRSIDQSHLDRHAGEYSLPTECFICLEEFVASHQQRKPEPDDHNQNAQSPSLIDCRQSLPDVTLHCKHKFHVQCLRDWYNSKQPRSVCCPVCITLIRLQGGHEFRGTLSDDHQDSSGQGAQD